MAGQNPWDEIERDEDGNPIAPPSMNADAQYQAAIPYLKPKPISAKIEGTLQAPGKTVTNDSPELPAIDEPEVAPAAPMPAAPAPQAPPPTVKPASSKQGGGFRSARPKELSHQLASQVPGAKLNTPDSVAGAAPSSSINDTDPDEELSSQLAHAETGRNLNGTSTDRPDRSKIRNQGVGENMENLPLHLLLAGKPYADQSPEEQAASRALDRGRAPDDDRFANRKAEQNFNNKYNPNKQERKMSRYHGSIEPGPGKLAPRSGERDPEKFGGTPFDKYNGQKGAKGLAAKGGKRFGNYMKRHPRGTIALIAAFVSAFIGLLIFAISLPFQMIQMAQMLLDHNFKAGDRIEQKASRRVMARLFQVKTTENGGNRKATGRPISDKIANMRMDRFNKLLAKDDLIMQFDEKGRLTGIKSIRTGEVLKDFSDKSFLERRSAVSNLVSERIAPWRVLKRLNYTRVMKYHARVSFRFWPKDKVQDIKKLMAEKVRVGAAPDELDTRNTAPIDPSDPDNSKVQGADDADEITRNTRSVFERTGNKVAAIREGVKQFRARNAKVLGLTGILAMVCGVKKMADDAQNKGYTDRADMLMRAGNMIPTAKSQMFTGDKLTIDKFGMTMSRFNGDPSAPEGSVDRKGWDQSAAAKRMLGEPVVTDEKSPNYNPEFSEAANPDGFALRNIVSRLDYVFDKIPGANFTCKAATSIFGVILGGIETVASVVTSGGVLTAAANALKAAVSVVVIGVILPKALAAAANIGITGSDNSVDMFSNADAGLKLSQGEYVRSYGAAQINDTTAVSLENASHENDVQIAREKGWLYRNISLNNTKSTLAKLMMKVPNTPSTALANITQLPQHMMTNLGTIFFRPSLAADTATINPYGFQFYGFTDAELDKYPDPVANEEYLTQPIDGTTKTRLSVLGDTSEYSPEDGDDPDMNNLRHCFVNKYRTPEALKEDKRCKGIGQITSPNGSQANNPGNDIVADIYADNELNIPVGDDFLRYRMQLLYTHIIRGVECQSNEEDCFKGKGATTPATTTPVGAAPSGDVQSLAKQILANGNVSYWTNSIGINTRDVLVALAAGKPAYTTCTAANATANTTPAPNKTADINPNILKFILESASQSKITVNALTDKCHEKATSNHYSGQAVDLEDTVGSLSVFNSVAAKYGGKKNGETGHHHFNFPK